MKIFKKFMGIITALVMLFALAMPAYAVDITVNNANKGSTYSAYKLLSATVSESGTEYAYTMVPAYSSILQTATNTDTDAKAIDAINDMSGDAKAADLRAFANTVYTAIGTNSIAADATETDTTNVGSVKFTGLDAGYYLIAETAQAAGTQTAYSLVMLNTVGKDNINIETKTSVPELEKKVQEKNDTTGVTSVWQDAADYDIGDSVPFQLTGTVVADYDSYTSYYYAFHDVMSEGLDFDKDTVKVFVDSTEITTGFSVVTTGLEDGCTFEVQFENLKNIASVQASSKIVVTYNAILNENAEIGSAGNPNTAKLEYSNNPYDETKKATTPEDKVIVFTYKIVAKKVNSANPAQPLPGAGFTLYKEVKENGASSWKEIKKIHPTDDVKPTEFTFAGIDAGKYKLSETVVPAGYNKIDDIIFIVDANYNTDAVNPTFISLLVKDEQGTQICGDGEAFVCDTTNGTVTTDIVNQSGTQLPSTGGIGTTLFYVIGGGMMLLALVLLVTKKRVSKNK